MDRIILHVNACEAVEGSGITGAVTSRGGIRLQYKQGKLNKMGRVDSAAPSRQDQSLLIRSSPCKVNSGILDGVEPSGFFMD